MVSAIRAPGATYRDIEALPEGQVGELLGGTLYAHARPATPHAMVASHLVAVLMPPFDRGVGGPGGWVVLFKPELHFDDDVLVPDLAGWRRERMPEVPVAPYLTLEPDWVCEVLSPGTERVDRMLKLPIYARAGVRWVWLVNAIERSIEVYRREGDRWVLALVAGDGPDAALEPFDAVPLDLAYLWSR